MIPLLSLGVSFGPGAVAAGRSCCASRARAVARSDRRQRRSVLQQRRKPVAQVSQSVCQTQLGGKSLYVPNLGLRTPTRPGVGVFLAVPHFFLRALRERPMLTARSTSCFLANFLAEGFLVGIGSAFFGIVDHALSVPDPPAPS
jgi:hypothetical protein